jgi:hypothetical protein
MILSIPWFIAVTMRVALLRYPPFDARGHVMCVALDSVVHVLRRILAHIYPLLTAGVLLSGLWYDHLPCPYLHASARARTRFPQAR